MQDFGFKIGWARPALFLSAVLLVVLGIVCFVDPHGFLPEPMHNTGLPDGLTGGSIFGAVVALILGVALLGAFKNAGGSRNVSGFMLMTGVFTLFLCAATLLDPVFGTLSYEWVIAVFVGLWGLLAILEALCGARVVGYRMWAVEVLMGLVMIGTAVGVLLDSSNAATMAGVAFIAAAIHVATIPAGGKGIQVAA